MNKKKVINSIEKELFSIKKIGQKIIEFTGDEPATVWENIVGEIDDVGYNMQREAKKYKIDNFIFNDKMIELYTKSNAFIYESSIESSRQFRRAKWSKIVNVLLEYYKGKDKSNIDILVYGDSVGNDSIYLSKLGFNVFYFDFESYCAAFASYKFDKHRTKITRLSSLKDLNILFDVVVCIEVAEHSPDPPGLIKEISSLIKKDGMCIFSEGFEMLSDNFPTHLKSNIKYIGQSIKLFKMEGFYLLGKDIDNKPYYFSKDPKLKFSLTFIKIKLIFILIKILKVFKIR